MAKSLKTLKGEDPTDHPLGDTVYDVYRFCHLVRSRIYLFVSGSVVARTRRFGQPPRGLVIFIIFALLLKFSATMCL